MTADDTTDRAPVESENGLSGNGLSANGLSLNGLSLNGLSANGLSANGLSGNGLSGNGLSGNGLSLNGLSGNGLSGNGLMTTDGGRAVVKYIAKCALPSGHSLNYQDQYNVWYSYPGLLGVAPEWETGACGYDCQERVSACMLAHVNNSGFHIAIWLDSESSIGWGKSPDYPYEEGTFFGNLFPANNMWRGYYCLGTGYDQGAVPGRLGATIPNTSVYVNAWSGANCPIIASGSQPTGGTCVRHSDGSGMDNCTNQINGVNNTWKHVVTVWRNFDSNTVYQICGWSSGTCLAASGTGAGAAVKSMFSNKYDTSQQWWVIQVSAGKYKFINVATGMAMDVNSSGGLVQNAYSGAASQLAAINTLGTSQVGRFGVVPSSATWSAFNMTAAGTQAYITTNMNMDSAKLVLTGVAALTYGSGGSGGGSGGTTGSGGTGGSGGSGGGATVFSDNFDGQTLGTTTPASWTRVGGSSGDWSIASDGTQVLAQNASTSSTVRAETAAGTVSGGAASISAQVKLVATGSSNQAAMACLRYTDSSNYYCAALGPTGVQIKTAMGGTANVSAIWPATVAVGSCYALKLSSNSSGVLTASLGGTAMGTYTPPATVASGSAAVATTSMRAEFDSVVVTGP
jgi:hypothetical protein